MTAERDIAEARALLERAEKESDPEQECERIEEALVLLETADPTPPQEELIANVRMAYARRFLGRISRLKKSTFEVWSYYLAILENLAPEIEALTAEDEALAENRRAFVEMWGPEVQAALERSAKD